MSVFFSQTLAWLKGLWVGKCPGKRVVAAAGFLATSTRGRLWLRRTFAVERCARLTRFRGWKRLWLLPDAVRQQRLCLWGKGLY